MRPDLQRRSRRAQLEDACRYFVDALPLYEREGFQQMAAERGREPWQEVAAALVEHAERWLAEGTR